LIHHGRWCLTKTAAVFPLAVAMIELPFGALPVSSVGASPLLTAGLLAALVATVAVSPIAMRADEENRVAALTQASPLPQNRFAMNHRHASSPAGTGQRQWSRARLKPALFGFTCRMVAEHETLPL
jgi:hypothetical protein